MCVRRGWDFGAGKGTGRGWGWDRALGPESKERGPAWTQAWAGSLGAAWEACVDGGAPLRGGAPPSRAFLEYYQEHLEYACPTEDIYLE